MKNEFLLFIVRRCLLAGLGIYISMGGYATPPPSSPSGLTVRPTAGTHQISLSWSVTPGAAGYKVKRSNHAAGPYYLLQQLPDTTFTDTTATAGTLYYYTVTALDAGGGE